MTATAFAFLLTGVLLNAGAPLLLKAGTNVLGVITLTRENWLETFWRMGTQGYFVAGVAFYMVSLVVWIMGLSRVPVSVAYPMLSLGYAVYAFLASWPFGESLTVHKLAGFGFIIICAFLVPISCPLLPLLPPRHRFSHTTPLPPCLVFRVFLRCCSRRLVSLFKPMAHAYTYFESQACYTPNPK